MDEGCLPGDLPSHLLPSVSEKTKERGHMTRVDKAWQTESLVRTFLDGIRGGIPAAREQIDVMMRLASAMEGPVGRVLDLGCGDGLLASSVLAGFPGAEAVLLDFSPAMLEAASRRFEGGRQRVRIVEGDFATGGWMEAVKESAPFDFVVSGYAIHHQADERKKALFSEIYSLLRPGGLFVNMDHVASRTGWAREISDELFIESLHEYSRARGREESFEEVAEKFHHRSDKEANVLSTVEDQCAWLRGCGFERVDCYFKLFELAVFAGLRPPGEKG